MGGGLSRLKLEKAQFCQISDMMKQNSLLKYTFYLFNSCVKFYAKSAHIPEISTKVAWGYFLCLPCISNVKGLCCFLKSGNFNK